MLATFVRGTRSRLLVFASLCAVALLLADLVLRLAFREISNQFIALAFALDAPLLTLTFGGLVALALGDLDRRAQQALVEAERQTLEEARLEGALLVSREVAHRFRNYLTIIQGTLEHLANDETLDARLRGLVLASLASSHAATVDLDQLEQIRRISTYRGAAGPSLDLRHSVASGADASPG